MVESDAPMAVRERRRPRPAVRWFDGPAMSAYRRVEIGALLGTIPAFYLALQRVQPVVHVALYGIAFVATVTVLWNERFGSKRGGGAPTSHDALGLLLAVGLALSAVLPPGDEVDWITVRLGTAMLVVLRMGDSLRPTFWRGQLPRVLPLSIGVLALCGLGFWWLEPTVRTFGDGLWLAFTTAATVGYGDVVPSTPASKIFSVFVVLMGFAVLSMVTAAIATSWIQSEERRIEREILSDLHRQLRQIHEELAALREAARR